MKKSLKLGEGAGRKGGPRPPAPPPGPTAADRARLALELQCRRVQVRSGADSRTISSVFVGERKD